LGGVAGGIGDYLNIDVTLVRLLFVLTFFFGGSGLLIYLIAWVIVPEQPLAEHSTFEESATPPTVNVRPSNPISPRSYSWLGLILIGLGVYLIIQQFLPRFAWSILLIGFGLAVLLLPRKRS
jgi:phage shock protein PspC (stress-responsive transcriptional regulator)